jgi:DNA-directed RNA polymerase specialized sigma24 family protein
MTRMSLSDVDVFRLYCEGCNANEIGAAMQIPSQAAAALIARSRVLYARAQESRRPGPLHLSHREAA